MVSIVTVLKCKMSNFKPSNIIMRDYIFFFVYFFLQSYIITFCIFILSVSFYIKYYITRSPVKQLYCLIHHLLGWHPRQSLTKSLWMSPYPVVYILCMNLNHLYCVFFGEINKHFSSSSSSSSSSKMYSNSTIFFNAPVQNHQFILLQIYLRITPCGK